MPSARANVMPPSSAAAPASRFGSMSMSGMADLAGKAIANPNQVLIDEGMAIAEPYIPEEY